MKHVLKWPMIAVLLVGTLAFEIFNYTNSEYGMASLIGAGEMAKIAALAFCLADIAGLVRVFTPETSMSNEPKEIALLAVAWIVASITNAGLTWYAFLTAMSARDLGNAIISQQSILEVFPVLIAIMTLVARLGLIGSVATGIDSMKAPKVSIPTMKMPSLAKRPIAKPAVGRPVTSTMPFKPRPMSEPSFVDLLNDNGHK